MSESPTMSPAAPALASSHGLSDTEPQAPAVPGRRHLWTLTVACTGVALVISSMVALNTVLGEIAVATSATQTQLTWVVDSYTLALACLLLPAGAIGDRYGRRCDCWSAWPSSQPPRWRR